MKRIGLSLALLFFTAHLVSASPLSQRFAPSDHTVINPNVFSWLFKLFLVSDSLPTSLRIGNTSLLGALNFHIQDNGGQPLAQPEIDNLVAMKTYYLSLGPAGKTLYLEFLEGITWALQRGLLDVMVANPQAYWDNVFLGIAQPAPQEAGAQEPGGQELMARPTRQAETGSAEAYKEVDQQFAAEIQEIVGDQADVLDDMNDKIDAAMQQAHQAEMKAADAGVRAQQGIQNAAAAKALAQSGIDQLNKVRGGTQEAKGNANLALDQNVKQQRQINTLKNGR